MFVKLDDWGDPAQGTRRIGTTVTIRPSAIIEIYPECDAAPWARVVYEVGDRVKTIYTNMECDEVRALVDAAFEARLELARIASNN